MTTTLGSGGLGGELAQACPPWYTHRLDAET
jgi:hypothetical protein